MTANEWKKSIEAIGGQVLDVPPENIETIQNLVAEWQAAHREHHEAELLLHAYLKSVLPQMIGWEYSFDTDTNRVTLLFEKDKK